MSLCQVLLLIISQRSTFREGFTEQPIENEGFKWAPNKINIDKKTKNNLIQLELTILLTPQSGRSSRADVTNSFPYFATNCLRTSVSSGISAHLGDANITLDIASFRSMGQFLLSLIT